MKNTERKLSSKQGFDLLEYSSNNLVIMSSNGSVVATHTSRQAANQCLDELTTLSASERRLLGLTC